MREVPLERFTIGLIGVVPRNIFQFLKTGFISLNSKDISAQLQSKTFYTFVNRFSIECDAAMEAGVLYSAFRIYPCSREGNRSGIRAGPVHAESAYDENRDDRNPFRA
jgi:hypothetical protein